MNKATFAPQLFIKNGVKNIEFYTKAFGAIELRRWTNDDGVYMLRNYQLTVPFFIFTKK